MTAILELRTADAAHRADFFDKGRLVPTVLVDGAPIDAVPELVRRGPGVWFYVWTPPPGLGGSRATFGATFDGAPVVEPRTVPIASDAWNARYPSHARGNQCSITGTPTGTSDTSGVAGGAAFALALLTALGRRRR
jgi:MYXO-CTERM domain-containing protein